MKKLISLLLLTALNTDLYALTPTCEKLLGAIPSKVVTLKIIDQSDNSDVEKCIAELSNDSELSIVADKNKSELLVDEMIDQHELPSDEAMLNQIGKMIVPHHLLLINSLKTPNGGVTLTSELYEIESGKLINRTINNFSFLDLHRTEIGEVKNFVKSYYQEFLIAIFLIIFRIKRKQRQNTIENSNLKYREALAAIQNDEFNTGLKLMTEVAEDGVKGGASTRAIKYLNGVKTILQDEC